MKKVVKVILLSIGCVLGGIILLLLTLLIVDKCFLHRYDFITAVENCDKFLSNNIDDLTQIANRVLSTKSVERDVKIKGVFRPIRYISYYNGTNYPEYYDMAKEEYVSIDLDAQGMLGGQYWGLLYIPENSYHGEEDIYIWDEKKERGEGNNIMIRGKLRDNWFFYYDDYDGFIEYIDEIKAIKLAQKYVEDNCKEEFKETIKNFEEPGVNWVSVKNKTLYYNKDKEDKISSVCWKIEFSTDLDAFVGTYDVHVDFVSGKVYGTSIGV